MSSAGFKRTHARSANAGSYQHLNGLEKQNNSSSTDEEPQAATSGASSLSSGFWKDMSLVYRIYQQCVGAQMSVCLKVKLLTGLEKAFRMPKSLQLYEGIQFVSNLDDDGEKASKRAKLPPISEQDIEAVLPRSSDAKEQVLNNMILKRLGNFLQEHTLQ
ncbi:uncharacterized protein LOC115625639, partial [Scaptodrosophila lebanonensis]|uniref:Uncharacterized protein LOC115625639 n=1 Tax=Drosophila lebanonensis TaxID=7225 RepID=A0A6J2TNC1_DROLE